MTSATQMLWISAGQPKSIKGKPVETNEPCALCGFRSSRMVTFKSAISHASFSGYAELAEPTSSAICEACSWALEGKPPNTLRMWSIVCADDLVDSVREKGAPDFGPDVHVLNKHNLDPVLSILLDPPSGRWFCALADSGKIHVVPYCKVNAGRGRWSVQLERETIWGTPDRFKKIVHHVASLLDAGFAKRDISGRSPPIKRLAEIGIDLWRQHIIALGPGRGGQLERTAIFLLKKETANGWKKTTA